MAVYLGDVEEYIDRELENPNPPTSSVSNSAVSVLDLIQVDRHADAKLRGFGACTRLWNGWDRSKIDRPEYLLLSGKGIKVRKLIYETHLSFFSMLLPLLTFTPYALHTFQNIHIWSFKPSRLEK